MHPILMRWDSSQNPNKNTVFVNGQVVEVPNLKNTTLDIFFRKLYYEPFNGGNLLNEYGNIRGTTISLKYVHFGENKTADVLVGEPIQ